MKFNRPVALLIVWVAAVLVVSAQVTVYRHANFEIFRLSWHNLLAGKDLYGSYPPLDVFIYTPTFAVLFAPFALLPLWLGILLWNAANAGALYWGLGRALDPDAAFVARAIVLLDAIGSMQNVQSNALVAGLMIMAFGSLDRRQEFRAAVAVGLGTIVKVFPLAAATFAIFRPYRVPRFTLYGVLVGLVLLALPLLVISPSALLEQYRSWNHLQSGHERGLSIMQHVRMWSGSDVPSRPIQLIGLVVLLAPLVQVPHWASRRFRLLFLASTLMFCVLFNHAAESPSFVIAVAGVAIWFAVSRRDAVAWIVLGIVFLGTTLSATDVIPGVIRQQFFVPYKVKTLPIVLVWIITQVELWRRSVTVPFSEPVRVASAT
ncbi:MAG TPA: glycosyltransferase family 87 protein [Gemmatimonadaceae bacterium]|nr:glycosyltransferase family 87 protein [Gemmatimonadaceae bacterium]